jgi:hypothetical protein
VFKRLGAMLFGIKQPDSGPELASVQPISSPALSHLFQEYYSAGQLTNQQATQLLNAGLAGAFAEADPLPIAIELLTREPMMWSLACRENSDATRRLSYVFNAALQLAWDKSAIQHGTPLPIGPEYFDRLLAALSQIAARENHSTGWGVGRQFRPVIEAVCARSDINVRAGVIKLFGSFFQSPGDSVHAAQMVTQLLPLTAIAADEIPDMAAFNRYQTEMAVKHQQVIAAAGAVLGVAVAAVLSGSRSINNHSLREAEKTDALQALAKLSSADRGVAFRVMIDLVGNPQRFGIGRWGELALMGGFYSAGVEHAAHLHGFTNIIMSLGTRKIDLVDADQDIANLLKSLPEMHGDTPKKLVKLILKTVVEYPFGKAAVELRALQAENKTYMDDFLRNLPNALPESVLVRGAALTFGFESGDQPPSQSGTAPGQELPPIALPEWPLFQYSTRYTISTHFDNLFEPRLYDPSHVAFLRKIAALGAQIKTQGPSAEGFADTCRKAAAEVGFSPASYAGSDFSDFGVRETLDFGANLHKRFSAFAPLVQKDTELWRALALLAGEITGKSVPGKKWLARGHEVLDGMAHADRLAIIEALFGSPATASGASANESHLRTLIYLSADLDPQLVGPKLVTYALKQCYVTLPGHGIHAEKLGNACVWTLAAMPEGAGLPYLARILARVKYPKVRAKIDAALDDAATAANMPRHELDEITVPTHELDREGMRRIAFAEGSAVIRVDGRDVAIDWYSPDGKPLKSASVAMKAQRELLAEVRADAKELAADLAIQPQRLQCQYLDARRWRSDQWCAHYLDHPLMRTLTRRLVWWVEDAAGEAVAALADATGAAMCDVTGAIVSLEQKFIRPWHPMAASAEEVEAWRDRLELLGITQPFAQVWREIYAITDAERTTGTYSNRWAAHILRQHQAMTLARLNNWRVTHRMWVDAPNDTPWHLMIPAHGLLVDYWITGAGGNDPEVSDSNAYTYVSTDRIQFHLIVGDAPDGTPGLARGRAVALADVPPVVFSEIMRHADLFTSVTSIAADPNWLDRGADAAHPGQWNQDATAYWTRMNNSALEESGKRRRAILERVVTKLKIASQLSFEDRYLVVEGSRHKYRIHLGSGACFRGEQHICIVPKAEMALGRIWLPFEGDQTLSIILSKAVLLAADTKITDPVILRQL